jgi:hypothetical protein
MPGEPHEDETENAVIPASPANPDGIGGRLSRRLFRGRLRLHLRRMLIISAAVLFLGAGASLFLAILGTSTCEDTKAGRLCTETSWYPLTLQRKSVVTTLNGERHGPRTDWFSNGRVWLEGEYLRGERVGRWSENYWSGTPRFEGRYARGKLEGTETWWFANGNREWEIERRKGERHGRERWWHESGQLRRDGRFLSGEREGEFLVFDLDGEQTLRVKYERGERVALATGSAD